MSVNISLIVLKKIYDILMILLIYVEIFHIFGWFFATRIGSGSVSLKRIRIRLTKMKRIRIRNTKMNKKILHGKSTNNTVVHPIYPACFFLSISHFQHNAWATLIYDLDLFTLYINYELPWSPGTWRASCSEGAGRWSWVDPQLSRSFADIPNIFNVKTGIYTFSVLTHLV